jgi:anti-sigma factor RsiW
MTQTPSFRDVEKLSAYLDGQLKPSEVARLEARLQTDPQLASILQDLRQTRSLLRQLPQRRAPRNFTLTPKMVGQKPPLPRTYPVFRFATVLATLLLFFTFATNFMAPRLVRTAAPYPYGIGGGGGGDAEPELQMQSAPEAQLAPNGTPQPAEEPAAAPAMEEPATSEELATPEGIPQPAPTEMPPAANDSARAGPTAESYEKSGVQAVPTGENFAQQTAPVGTPERQPARPISPTIQIALAVIALLSGLVAIALRYSAIRKWRAKAK